ncbi:Uncharacterised protein [Vibrio cholerae]|nr:Uncharacterised protein [Vibrio cholerae]
MDSSRDNRGHHKQLNQSDTAKALFKIAPKLPPPE